MRRAISNHLPPMGNEPDLPGNAIRYRDMGAMMMLDLCLWAGAKDVDITEYVAALKPRIDAATYLLTLDHDRRPCAYSIWDRTEDSTVVKRQTVPFGDHTAHIEHLRRHLRAEVEVSAEFEDAPEDSMRQRLW